MVGFQIFSVLGAGIAIGMGAIGSGIGEGFIAMKAVQSLGRQPKASGKILRTMIISQAITETAAIFSLIIALLLMFQPEPTSLIKGVTMLAAGIAMGFGAIGAGIGAGFPGGACMDGIGKKPSISIRLITNMVVGQAITQTSTIFALTISLILVASAPAPGWLKLFAMLGAGIAMGFGAIGPGIGDGLVAKHANGGVARDVQNFGLLTRTMIIGQAITETTDIYAMVIALILIFVV